jgi:dTDP-4-dehydrorhamnose reductase
VRFLILGGDGMLGHQLYKRLRAAHETRVTLRQGFASYVKFGLFESGSTYPDVDMRDAGRLSKVLSDFRPQVVVNAVGIVKQRADAKDSIQSIEINALLPHRLEVLCGSIGARLIHLSTDCVFSGRTGNYSEASPPDPQDLYGRSKLLGEVGGRGCLTLRTSMIGPELQRKTGLLEWLLAQNGTVKGYRSAVFSGFTTLELSRIIERVAVAFPEAHGVYHVASEPINKCELLKMIKRALDLKVEVVPDDAVKCDRSLDSSRFRAEFGYTLPTWDQMIQELAASVREAQS